MQGLPLRLSSMHDEAESTVCLIGFFDGLIEQHVDLPALVRHTAMIAGCSVGLEDPHGLTAASAFPDGTVGRHVRPPGATQRTLRSGHAAWISRGKTDGFPLDQILLERFAIACAANLARTESTVVELGDPALLELAVGRPTSATERSRAIALLGITPTTQVAVLAVRGPWERLSEILAQFSSGVWHRQSHLGEVHVVSVADSVPRDLRIPPGFRVGVSNPHPASELPTAWEGAARALRYTAESFAAGGRTERAMVFHEDLGPYDLLAARLRPEDITDIPDVEVLDQLADCATGQDLIRTVEVVAMSGSIREAARELHIHHNSVATRVARVQSAIGYAITTPQGMVRINLALALQRLRDNDLYR
ncbi:PucR family transcriptional regulator [Rhodococcus koreensis]